MWKTGTRKWRWVSHTMRGEGESIESEHWIGICRETKGEEDRSKPANGPFWSKQENAVKYGARLRVWRATEWDGDASQMACVASGTGGYTTTTTTTATATINFFNKTNKTHEFPKFYFVKKKLYMFRGFPLPIIRSFLMYIRHWYISCRFDDSFLAGSEWPC